MKKRLLALLLVFAMLLPVFNMAAFADDGDTTSKPYSVTVYFSVTDDGRIVDGVGLQKVTVPYFDLKEYGLEQFYFSSEHYTSVPGWKDYDPPESDLEPGTSGYAKNQITMLHLFIYALERFRFGQDPEDCGKGYLYKNDLMDSNYITVSGSVGSMFLYNYWGMDYNLNYYRNYSYPLASDGWGATADQILLYDDDVITLGHFSSPYFFSEPNSIFGYIQPTASGAGSTLGEVTVAANSTVDFTLYHAGEDGSGNYTTAHTPLGAGIYVYWCSYDELADGVVGEDSQKWHMIETPTDANGVVHVNTAKLGTGTFFLAMPGQTGTTYPDKISCTPGGIRLVVQ